VDLRAWAHRWVDALDREALTALHNLYGDEGCPLDPRRGTLTHVFLTGHDRCICGLARLTADQKAQVA
jgi:hypothetical protein